MLKTFITLGVEIDFSLHIYSNTENKYGKPNEISDFYLSDEKTLIVSDGEVYDDPYLYEAYRNEYRWSDGIYFN